MRTGNTRNCATFHATSMSPVEAGHDVTLTVTIIRGHSKGKNCENTLKISVNEVRMSM